MAFFLFILVNAALFIRPGEIVPALLGWEIYFYVILACLIAAAPEVLRALTGQSLDAQPITLCVFGMLIAILVPSLLAGDMAEAWRTGFYFAKVIVYYLLFVSLVTTPARLRILLTCILVFCGAVTLLAVLRYHDVIHLETLETMKDSVSGDYGESISIKRLQGTGIFQDPNELCVLLSAMLPLSLYLFLATRNIILKIAYAGVAPLFGYAVYLTQSRGGFLAFLGGLAVLSWIRLGWRKTLLVGAIGFPALFFLFAGRQTEISTTTGTAQTRVELWRDWLTTFRENPLFGKGMTLKKDDDPSRPEETRPEEERRHEAHNSYLQIFADLGFFGGCLFVGAFVTAGWSIYRLQSRGVGMLNADLKQMQPYVFAALAAYCIGMMTLSIPYMIPTFLMLALAVANVRMAQRSCLIAPAPLRLDLSLLARYLAAGVCTLGMIYVFVRFLA